MSKSLVTEIEDMIKDNDICIENENRMFAQSEIDKAEKQNQFLHRVLQVLKKHI